MARLLVRGDWYEEVAPTAFYESEFEQLILDQSALLFPEFHCVPFKTLVYDEEGAAKADLALLDKQYLAWWVVEVEMGHHPFQGHVLPQVRTLARAAYGEDQIDFLFAQASYLGRDRLVDLMKGKQPKVMVVVNTPRPSWVEPLARYEAILAIVEVFRSSDNRHVFRVNGEYPVRSMELVSTCAFDTLIPRFLCIDAPAALGVPPHSKVKLWYDGRVTEWERVDSQNKVWLSPNGPSPMPKKGKYQILRLNDGSLAVEHVRR